MSKHEDNVSTRMVDRIIATAYKEAREALLASLARPCGIDKNLFSKAWIAKKIRRSEVFVKRNWKRNPYDVGDEERPGRPQKGCRSKRRWPNSFLNHKLIVKI